jgi:hypothetical protein
MYPVGLVRVALADGVVTNVEASARQASVRPRNLTPVVPGRPYRRRGS